jgi:hypothetical protein
LAPAPAGQEPAMPSRAILIAILVVVGLILGFGIGMLT